MASQNEDNSKIGKIKIILLNTPDTLSALKFPSWFKSEVASIDVTANTNDIVVIRLFLPQRLIFQIQRKKLDRLLQETADKHESIHLVDMKPTEATLTADELAHEYEVAEKDLKMLVKKVDESV